MKLFLLLSFLSLLLLIFSPSSTSYTLTSTFQGTTFFDNWNFFSGDDPTHGYVDYTTRQQATDWGLISTTPSTAIISSDHSSVSSGRGRAAVRISTVQSWNSGLFVLDLNHMPQGCGTWPAWWLVGPNWPNYGEIDIIEGVNRNTADQTTLHTSNGCDMSNVNPSSFSGKWGIGSNGQPSTNCYVDANGEYANQGCGIISPNGNYGSALNNQGGGVYALLWNGTNIMAWFWNHADVPGDLRANNPNPNGWGMPYALFILGGNCPNSHFKQMQMVINLTFCGDWAGGVFSSDCPGLGSCQSYVQNNPSKFDQAYWSINFIKVFT